MTWVIYNKTSFRLYSGDKYAAKHYKSKSSAKRVLTRMVNEQDSYKHLDRGDWAVTDYNTFLDMERDA